MARQDLQDLYSVLVNEEFPFIPSGIASLRLIYGLVQKEYPELCDDDYLCSENCSNGNDEPEWHHTIRKALEALKNQESRVAKYPERGFWEFSAQRMQGRRS